MVKPSLTEAGEIIARYAGAANPRGVAEDIAEGDYSTTEVQAFVRRAREFTASSYGSAFTQWLVEVSVEVLQADGRL